MTKVLILNTYHYLRGGDCTHAFALADLLRSNGHEVRFFSMHHPRNIESEDSKFFVDHIDFEELNRKKSIAGGVKVATRSIYSRAARGRLQALLKEWRPDIAHIHNIHAHITPSVIDELKAAGVPVVWTLHDYKLLCPNTHFLSNGSVCEACIAKGFFQCTIRKCKKGSRLASLAASMEAYVHRSLRIKDKVDGFIAPSNFLADKFAEAGWPAEKMHFLRNFLPEPTSSARDAAAEEGVSTGGDHRAAGDYGLFFGQLAEWKGVRTLLEAAASLPSVPVRIAGAGPLEQELIDKCRSPELEHVWLQGFVNAGEIERLLAGAAFVVVPSEWYENCPYAVMEALAAGKPVIAADIGGLPELVRAGETGLLFKTKDSAGLARAMQTVWDDPDLARRMGHAAGAFARDEFDAGHYYEQLTRVYESAGASQARTSA